MPANERVPNAEALLASYFARYAPAVAKLGKALRAKLRARLPGFFEIVYVYERQESLVISYSPTERGYEGLCGLALYPDCVKLFFTNGTQLSKADPNERLQGSGKNARYVLLASVADFGAEDIQALLAAALKLARIRLNPAAKGAVILKAESQKKRSSRANPVARATPARRPAKPKR